MVKQMLRIRCKNSQKELEVAVGSTLTEVYGKSGLCLPHGPVSAKVNNRVKGLDYCLYNDKDVEFLDVCSDSGHRTYTRTLFFVCCKAVHDLFPQSKVVIDIPVSKGYYVQVQKEHPLTDDEVTAIRKRMTEIIGEAFPVVRHRVPTEDAIRLFADKGDAAKVTLLKSTGSLYTEYYQIDDFVDYFYGSLLPNTAQLYLFGLVPYEEGMLLRTPSRKTPDVLNEMPQQPKLFEIFREQHGWQDIIGLRTVGDLNAAVDQGFDTGIIHVNEALQEKKIVRIADEIAARKQLRLVLLAGPSSSGKTTTCKRLSIQLIANGLRPVQISLDDYFVDRELTPKDEKGEYDYESVHALNIPLLNEQFNALFRGEEVELPKYDFPTGKSIKSGKRIRLAPRDILVVEGIHALNPELTAQIPEEQKFRVYASALTTILLDDHNYIPTTDNRLLRRIIRDYKYRGVSARDTIKRWPSVRAGEEKWIFPFQENADAMFNTAMLYELAVIKQQAQPLLEQVPENCEEYAEAYRLLKFLAYFHNIPYRQLPPTSLLREFLGGSSFKY